MTKAKRAEQAINEVVPIKASIDYRLRAQSIAKLVRQGNIFKSEVCDAHPELIRAAQGVGEPCPDVCPICEEDDLVSVRYMFGSKLGPGGRCVADLGELQHIAETKKGIFTCYVVEVCVSCSWNFLVQSFSVVGQLS